MIDTQEVRKANGAVNKPACAIFITGRRFEPFKANRGASKCNGFFALLAFSNG